jgi:hypothetical protein
MTAPTWSGTSTNITFTTDDSDTTVPWTITANSTTTTFNETMDTYLIPTTGYNQVGFVSTSDTAPTGAVTTGFGWYGKSVAYAASDLDYELQFWATETNETGIYGLYVCILEPLACMNANLMPHSGMRVVLLRTDHSLSPLRAHPQRWFESSIPSILRGVASLSRCKQQ